MKMLEKVDFKVGFEHKLDKNKGIPDWCSNDPEFLQHNLTDLKSHPYLIN
jgi:hypothetical protein